MTVVRSHSSTRNCFSHAVVSARLTTATAHDFTSATDEFQLLVAGWFWEAVYRGVDETLLYIIKAAG